jgi:hypothetical protein
MATRARTPRKGATRGRKGAKGMLKEPRHAWGYLGPGIALQQLSRAATDMPGVYRLVWAVINRRGRCAISDITALEYLGIAVEKGRSILACQAINRVSRA